MEARALLKELINKEHIDLYAAISLENCRIIRPDLLEPSRHPFCSVILYALPYFTGIPEERNLSLYAISKDYHACIKNVNARLIEALSAAYPAETFIGFGDHSPIDERLAAARAGLGVRGDNGLLITGKYGSYVFLGEVLTTLPAGTFGEVKPGPIKECLHCGACGRVCPTGFEDCASRFSQKKGELTAFERAAVLKTGLIWGCDLCQTCCPMNRTAEVTPIPFFHEDRIEVLTEEALMNMDKNTFRRRAFSWHGRSPLLRNLSFYNETGQDPVGCPEKRFAGK